jgi:hypothetical protein
MAENAVLDQKQTVSYPGKPQTLPMEEALEQVRRDSRQDPEVYLDETVVPHGGE